MPASLLRPAQVLCLVWLSVFLLVPSFAPAQQSSSTDNTSSASPAPAPVPELTANTETQTSNEDEQLASPLADSRAATPDNSLNFTELAPILRNPWVGVGGGLLLMLLLRFVYNYGRR